MCMHPPFFSMGFTHLGQSFVLTFIQVASVASSRFFSSHFRTVSHATGRCASVPQPKHQTVPQGQTTSRLSHGGSHAARPQRSPGHHRARPPESLTKLSATKRSYRSRTPLAFSSRRNTSGRTASLQPGAGQRKSRLALPSWTAWLRYCRQQSWQYVGCRSALPPPPAPFMGNCSQGSVATPVSQKQMPQSCSVGAAMGSSTSETPARRRMAAPSSKKHSLKAATSQPCCRSSRNASSFDTPVHSTASSINRFSSSRRSCKEWKMCADRRDSVTRATSVSPTKKSSSSFSRIQSERPVVIRSRSQGLEPSIGPSARGHL
mmetsp:Transcript_108527/g.305905  ORF Transcript_108527/g.305905 Transcript_108527/m.305905 type:complete len:319 (+) Transcript_108527:697-1653(+)